jgi:hypothetical protein
VFALHVLLSCSRKGWRTTSKSAYAVLNSVKLHTRPFLNRQEPGAIDKAVDQSIEKVIKDLYSRQTVESAYAVKVQALLD